MNNDIKEILGLIGNAYYYGKISEEEKNKYCEYITNLQEELKSANESITWWQNRFNALQEKNKNLKKAFKSTTEELCEYATRNEKAIDLLKEAGCYDEETKTFCDDVWEELPKLLNILNGGDDND